MNTTKNYHKDDGDVFVVGGEISVVDEGKLTFDGTALKPAANQADSSASTIADLRSDFNSLLTKLKASGLMLVDE
ncbi:MAG TPA: Head fiber protein [Pseudobacteroides sp.]|uniref:Head fiber protein n=1 Tax=Pseudobacteroides sp. TaxID=1968840 RepID=UPI002F91E045